MISKDMLKELEQIIKEEFGIKINPKELSDFGNTLVDFFDLLVQINNKK